MAILEHSEGKVQNDGKGPRSLPCLFSNNSNEIPLGSLELSAAKRRSATALAHNVKYMCDKYSIQNIGFLTLTFADHVTDYREATKRLNTLKTGVLNERYPIHLRIMERQKNGRIHFHILINVGNDIRTGFDFDGIARRDYRSASKTLRAEWAFWRTTAKKYGFGRTELMPIRSSSEAVGRYLGKYISKHIGNTRADEDKGARLVEYSRGARMHSTNFQYATEKSKLWRRKVEKFAQIMWEASITLDPVSGEMPPLTFENFNQYLGPKWAYHWRDVILSLEV